MIAFELITPGSENTLGADAAKTLAGNAAELGLTLLSCGVYANSIRVLVPITVEGTILDEASDISASALKFIRSWSICIHLKNVRIIS